MSIVKRVVTAIMDKIESSRGIIRDELEEAVAKELPPHLMYDTGDVAIGDMDNVEVIAINSKPGKVRSYRRSSLLGITSPLGNVTFTSPYTMQATFDRMRVHLYELDRHMTTGTKADCQRVVDLIFEDLRKLDEATDPGHEI